MSMSLRVHGGPDALGVPAHDFSTNANACGPCPQALAAVQAADGTRYPDPAYTTLREALARRHGVEATRVVIAGSASEFIFRITGWAARQGVDAVAVPRHGYGDYAQAARAWGLRVTEGVAPLLWVCDPASPSGVAGAPWPWLPPVGTTVVLDRAYEPLRLGGAPVQAGQSLARIWQLWTPNKALGLTGVRGAYAIAPEGAQEQVRQIEALAPSWPVGAHGQAMLLAWCASDVKAWLDHSHARLRDWKARQLALCTSLGWACEPSDTNFMLCRVPQAGVLEPLRARGIKLRDCASFGLPGHVRMSVQPPASQDALATALKEIA